MSNRKKPTSTRDSLQISDEKDVSTQPGSDSGKINDMSCHVKKFLNYT